MERHLTPSDLDALALGFVTPVERARFLAHAGGCGTCGRDRSAHAAYAREFLEDVAPRTLPVVRRRIAAARARPAPRGRVWLWPVGLVAAAASFALWVRAVPTARQPDAASRPTSELGIKGGGALHVFAKQGDRVFEVTEGTALSPGDAIRFFLDPGELGFVIVGSIDGAGKASIYYPHDRSASAAIAPGRRLEVPLSVVLDHAPGPERLFAVFSRAPLAAAEMRAALEALGARGPEAIRRARDLPLEGTVQTSLRFEKEEAP
jgi:hypothetical protein